MRHGGSGHLKPKAESESFKGRLGSLIAGLKNFQWRPLVLALLIGGLGGLLFNTLNMPLAWMLGAMFATGVAGVGGLSLGVSRNVRDPWITILGVMLGSGFSVDMLAGLTDWIPSILALPFYIVILGLVGRIYLRRFAGFDSRTAFFAASPGGLAEMILLGDRYGGDMRTIALIHSMRVFLVVTMLPLLLSVFLPDSLNASSTARAAPQLSEFAWLIACAVGGYWLGAVLRLPAPQMFGPMLLSAVTHLLGLVEAAPPVALVAGAQIVMGASLGSRFAGVPLYDITRALVIGLGLAVIFLALSALLAWLISLATDMPFVVLLLAFSPGGVAEMGLVALAIGVDPTFVATIHILRIATVVVSAPLLFKLFGYGKSPT